MCSLDCGRPRSTTRDEQDYCTHDHDGQAVGGDRTRADGDPTGTDRGRRSVLRASALGVAASLAGCLGGVLPGDDSEVPGPVSVAGGLDCDVCGMVIEKHPGPNGQIFYADESPEGHDNPARFDSLKQCFFPYKLEHDQMGWNIDAAYVTDYSSVEYDVSTQGGTTTISSHPEPDAFARAKDLQYVVNSEVEGAMGPDFIPFSTQGDAESFADEYGGEVVSYGDIGEGLVGR